MRGAVFRPLRTVRRNPFPRSGQPPLLIAQRTLESIAEDVKAGSVLVGGNGVGQFGAFGAWLEAILGRPIGTLCAAPHMGLVGRGDAPKCGLKQRPGRGPAPARTGR